MWDWVYDMGLRLYYGTGVIIWNCGYDMEFEL
jgi:hypothetical protein